MKETQKTQTHFFIDSKEVSGSSQLVYGAEQSQDNRLDKLYLDQAKDLLKVTQSEYDDLDDMDRIERVRDLKSETDELKDLLKAPDSELVKWANEEPVVVSSLIFATELRLESQMSSSPKFIDNKQPEIENALGEMFRHVEKLEQELNDDALRAVRTLGAVRVSQINRGLSNLRKASYVVALETARKKGLNRR